MPFAIGGIVLCGGRSTRMGRSKALLPFGNEVLLQRVVRVLGDVVGPVIVVAAHAQALPELPPGIRIARDEFESLGPLAGLVTGLAALRDEVDAAFVSACDAPLLTGSFVRRVCERLDDHDIAIPFDGRFPHPLAAVYRTGVETAARELLAQDRHRLLDLLDRTRVRIVTPDELRDIDPDLLSLRNVNTEAEYRAALRDAGL